MCAKKVKESDENSEFSGKNLRELLAEFDEIISWFSGENLDIEKSILQFEKGAKLAEIIREKLKKDKNEIEIIRRKFGEEFDENLEDFDDENPDENSRNFDSDFDNFDEKNDEKKSEISREKSAKKVKNSDEK